MIINICLLHPLDAVAHYFHQDWETKTLTKPIELHLIVWMLSLVSDQLCCCYIPKRWKTWNCFVSHSNLVHSISPDPNQVRTSAESQVFIHSCIRFTFPQLHLFYPGYTDRWKESERGERKHWDVNLRVMRRPFLTSVMYLCSTRCLGWCARGWHNPGFLLVIGKISSWGNFPRCVFPKTTQGKSFSWDDAQIHVTGTFLWFPLYHVL